MPAGSDTPLISVIIPTHNRRDMVCEAIDSVSQQTYSNIEIIVVDDGSTDGTANLLRNRYNEWITVIRREKVSNAAVARNLGVKASDGDFLAFLDSDDLWLPRKLELQMGVMLKYDEAVALVGGSCEYIDASGRPLQRVSIAPDSASYEDFCVRIRFPGSGSNNLIRREAFEEVGGFDEALTRAQDIDLWIRILRHYEVRYTKEITARIRLHGSPRVNVDIDTIIDCRRRVDRKIPEPALRRKATAWSYFSFFRRLLPTQGARALKYLFFSFLVHPNPLDPQTKRLRPAASMLLDRLR